MRNKLLLLILLLCSLFIGVNRAEANDFLELEKHYSAYTAGANKVHFKLPIYSRGAYDYYVSTNDQGESYVYYKLNGSEYKIFSYSSERASDGPSADDNKAYGRAWVRAYSGRGVVEITNIHDGQRKVVPNDNQEHAYDVKKVAEPDNDKDNVTWVEIDWYPQEALDGETFNIGTYVKISKRMTGNVNYTKNWILATDIKGNSNMIQAQLYDPYFYTVNNAGVTGYGNAAVPYMVFYDPKSYHTSLDATEFQAADRSGNIFVPTTDTVQENFYATFQIYRMKTPQEVMSTQMTTKVDIPPYHRIYNFEAEEEKDATGTYTGNNVLHWTIKNPRLVDLVDGDYFEIQRALKEDFSDAQQLGIQRMMRDSIGYYTFQDNSREIWTGNAAVRTDTVDAQWKTTLKHYYIYDDNGTLLLDVSATLTCNKGHMAAVPVYYRIRRATSSVWGWVDGFSRQVTLYKHNFLAPLANQQENYIKDAEWEKNHKVHFQFKIDNSEIQVLPLSKEDCSLNYTINSAYTEGTTSFTIAYEKYAYYTVNPKDYLTFRVLNAEKSVIRDWQRMDAGTYDIPMGGMVQVNVDKGVRSSHKSYEFTVWGNSTIKCKSTYLMAEDFIDIGFDGPSSPDFSVYEPIIKDSLFKKLQTEYAKGYGRCMWDRTARLILRRTIQETGEFSEFIIPQDSIKRQDDGSWIATYSDVADKACTHYSYSVRIDQSKSDLHVQDSTQLQPKVISGPSLYFDEAATITSFTASEGDAVGHHKRGVKLEWMASSTAVDQYVLRRVAKNSDAAPDTIYIGLDNNFFDETAVPNQRYTYSITAVYDCNGKSSRNSAEAVGWRSPYGEISGSVLMPDNSGMAGVTVTITGDGLPVTGLQCVTDPTGTFKFDSLTYNIATGSNYSIIPTHSYAVFSFNNTTAPTASIGLSTDNAVVEGLNFANTSTVRLTGRALYKYSTIPVAGAMFTLNGDTVRRNGAPVKTGTDGNFELTLSKRQPYVLRIVKHGHTFEGDGILRLEQGKDTFTLDAPEDGVRFYDMTTVRLVGRVAGGIDQRDLPEAFGLGTNNLGDDLQLVLQLEGDNIAQIVHDPNDQTRDTVQQRVQYASVKGDKSAVVTNTLFEKKRITIQPDPKTGEYAVDLFPVKYKVVQATAKGYATLFAAGQGSEVIDLTNAPLDVTKNYYNQDSAIYNAVYDRIYRSPVKVHLKQLLYGMEQDGYGEPSISVSGFDLSRKEKVQLYTKNSDGTVTYTLGHPLFQYNRRYQFEAEAFEDYYYNNDETAKLDRVPQRGGKVIVHNGMHSATEQLPYELDRLGKNSNVWLLVDHIQTQTYGEDALSTVSIALEQEGNTVETDAFQAFVIGDVIQANELTTADADITLLDIIRDPGGNGSSAWVENGTTYNYGYTESYDWKGGIKLTPKYGLNISNDIGIVTAPSGAGSYIGSNYTSSKQLSFTIPITHEWAWGYKYSYTFTTTDKISTSSSHAKAGVGSNADVFVGVMNSQLTGKAKSIAVINDTIFQARQPAIQAGTMHVLASGTGADNKPYYLVTGEKVVMGSGITNSFAYSQYYIMESVLPQLAMQRQNLLTIFPDSASAQAAANASDDVVYWYIDSLTSVSLHDTLAKDSYRMILPTNSTKAYPNRVAAIDNIIQKWCTILIYNEAEKVAARQSGQHVGTYSVNAGTTLSHSDSYSATANYNELPQGMGLIGKDAASAATSNAQNLLKDAIKNFSAFWGSDSQKRFGTTITDAISAMFKDEKNPNGSGHKTQSQLGTVTNASKWTMSFDPVLDFNSDARTSNEKTVKKSCGFTIVPDEQGDITVSVYRAEVDSLWKATTGTIVSKVGESNNDDILYGSYVFFTQAGATYCVHEKEEKTQFYNKGTVINNGTMALALPELSIDRHEVSSVPADQRAVFHIELKNEGQVQYGLANTGTTFSLSLTGDSNPHGAKVYINGAPLVQGLDYYLTPGQSITQVLEVERGEVDDYDNLTLYFRLADCPKTYAMLQFSAHFMPESSPVSIEMPRQNWVMNTLSPHDSIGYYLPVDIGGFNIHHKNFDHIEFQYKLSTESEEKWVNQCSFYASDSLYALATGNKAMIENGRIPQVRFYGERDPMEQQYELRAVCFCRYGSGFVTKASPVIRGTKDTRPPRVFGDPEPANAILGIGDHLLLRFNEPIAGNYLDEDNNFQLLGITNHTGISASTAILFRGTADSYAASSVERSLTDKSFTVEMMVKPTSPYNDEVFFTHGDKGKGLIFGKTADNRLYAQIGNSTPYKSKKLADPMLDFTRVAVTYSKENGFSFYVGTVDMTEPSALPSKNIEYSLSAPLIFGQGYAGQMLEARVWTKALTLEEIAATYDHYLTGYEQELLAYYRMSEGKGELVKDHAHGATLSLHGCTWNKLQGFSVQLAKEQRVELIGDLFGRSKVYDATLMFWFRTTDNAAERANLFSAGRTDDKHGALIALENGNIVLCSDSLTWIGSVNYADGEWHHVVLSINRTYNNAALFVDGSLIQTFPATVAAGAQGDMYLGGNFAGNIDEFAVFEQALPKSLVEAYDNIALVGDEMGLIAYLPFEEQFLNPNGKLEQRFSINDRRQFKDPATGKVIDKILPLVDGDITALADKTQNAPVTSHGALTKLNFDWSFNGDELMINLNMLDREINKQSIYVTVRDVEDLNGNPMRSPITWTAFVDHNSLKWADKQLTIWGRYGMEDSNNYIVTQIINMSGKRHTYKIESLPDWLTVDQTYGTIEPLGELSIKLVYKQPMPVGTYGDLIYVVDEDGLAEPLQIEYMVEAFPPYIDVDESKYPLNMSICGQVKINNIYDSDENDIIYAIYRNECIGKANVDYDNTANTSNVYLTIFGNEAMTGKTVNFILWQASTGRTYNLIVDRDVQFRAGDVHGCGNEAQVLFTTGGSETQNIDIYSGWNWISFNLNLNETTGIIRNMLTANEPWKEGDLIKNPSTQQFVTYSEVMDAFLGTIKAFDYRDMYMLYAAGGNTMHISGDPLPEDKMEITVKGGGEWSPMPCLLKQATTITEAFAGYYDNATPGDMVKAHNRFAVFSPDRKWVGDLTAFRPGEGYFFKRLAESDVTIKFYSKAANAPQRAPKFNGKAATNMTMICKVEGVNELMNEGVKAFSGDELVGIATPIELNNETLYFLTVSSDFADELRFETEDGTPLRAEQPIRYTSDAHHGSLKAPIILKPGETSRPYKIIEDQHVVIIKNGEKYDIDGKKLQ